VRRRQERRLECIARRSCINSAHRLVCGRGVRPAPRPAPRVILSVLSASATVRNDDRITWAAVYARSLTLRLSTFQAAEQSFVSLALRVWPGFMLNRGAETSSPLGGRHLVFWSSDSIVYLPGSAGAATTDRPARLASCISHPPAHLAVNSDHTSHHIA
jgi:hypothetical protein